MANVTTESRSQRMEIDISFDAIDDCALPSCVLLKNWLCLERNVPEGDGPY